MPKKQLFKQEGLVLDAFTGTGKRGDFHTLTANVNGREMSFFSDVTIGDAFIDKECELTCYLKASFDGKAMVQVASIALKK